VPLKKEKLPRELDPRTQLPARALLDPDSVELITDDDDSGMLARPVRSMDAGGVAFCPTRP
jgi:acetyl-CoA/propionyl-CoA carboxylase carboxyl transferase subunit